MKKNKYQEAGVNVEAGYESVELIKKHVASTNNAGSMSNIGGFGAMFDLKKYNFNDPILVSGTDGVGTKVEIAKELGIFDSVGIDLVAMCVNDIITIGAKPLFFLDYIAVDVNVPEKIEAIVKGICDGLRQCDCALIGGETAEMPGVYHKDGFDLAGFVVGAVERDQIIDSKNVEVGDVVIALPSSGIHSNGYSLVRKIVKEADLDLNKVYEDLDTTKTLGEVLLTPTRIYVNDVLKVIEKVNVKGIVHITGGGFYENIKRITNDYGVSLEKTKLPTLPIFDFLQKHGKLDYLEMFGYFNMGTGLMFIVKSEDVATVLSNLSDASAIGVVSEDGEIKIW